MRDARIRFGAASPFARELKARVAAHFAETGRSTYGGWRLWLKTGILFLVTGGAVALFLLGSGAWWTAVLYGMVAGLGMAGLGFSVEHDGGHGAYSSSSFVNRWMARVLDLLGASSYVWRWKHNTLHHTYPNLVGVDDDIEVGIWARLAPQQRRRVLHRYQHIYLWGLYSLLGLKWTYVDDYMNVALGRIGGHEMPRPRGWEWAVLFGGKALSLLWMLVLPILAHGVWMGLLFHVATMLVSGLTLSVVFQLAHCVEEAEFPAVPTPPDETWDWATHQLRTAVDFAPRRRFLTWYVGGLNFQAVHHLFPRICHLHYPRLAGVVAEVCGEYGVRYRCTPSFFRALRSHYRWLKRMGAPQPA